MWFSDGVKGNAHIFEQFANPSDEAFKTMVQDEMKSWKMRVKARLEKEDHLRTQEMNQAV